MFLQITEGREVVILQYIFLSVKGKKVKQSNSWATDGEQDQLGKSLWGMKGTTAERPLSRASWLPPAWDVFIF